MQEIHLYRSTDPTQNFGGLVNRTYNNFISGDFSDENLFALGEKRFLLLRKLITVERVHNFNIQNANPSLGSSRVVTVESNFLRKYLITDMLSTDTSPLIEEYQILPNPVYSRIGSKYVGVMKSSRDIDIFCIECSFNGGQFGYVATIFATDYYQNAVLDYNTFSISQSAN